MRRTRIVIVLMTTILLLSLTACNDKESETNFREQVYGEKQLSMNGIDGEIGAATVKNNRVYLNTVSVSEDENVVTKLYSFNLDGTDLKEIPFQTTELCEIMNIMVGEKDELTLAESFYDDKVDKERLVLEKIDKEGNEIARQDITEILNAAGAQNVLRFLMPSNGVIVAVTEQSAFIFDGNFKLKGEVKSEGYIEGAALTKDGQVVCAASELSLGGKKEIRTLDVDNKKWDKTYKVESGESNAMNILMDGADYDFYYKDNSGIYGYDIENTKSTKLMDFVASYLTADRTERLFAVNEGRFVGIANKMEGDGSAVYVYNKIDPSEMENKTVVTYGGLCIDENVKRAAMDFNRTNKEYRIEFKDYSEEENPIEKMNTDMIAGNIPDIMDLQSVSLTQYAEKGILENLTPYIEKDAELSSENIIESVWNAMLIDGKLYFVSPEFGVDTVIGSTKDVESRTGWTFSEFKEVLKNKGEDVRPFYSENKLDLLYEFLRYGCSDYVDWQTGECSFDSQAFKEILDFCNERGNDETANFDEYYPEMAAAVKDKKQMLISASGLTVEEIQMFSQMYEDDIAIIGYPGEEKQGSAFNFTTKIGISSKSEVKEAAWEFVRIFMTKNYQGKNDNLYSSPIRRDCFDMMLKAKTTTVEYKDELGQYVSPLSGLMEVNGLPVEKKPVPQKDADMYKALVNNTHKMADYNFDIIGMIVEEAEAYFKGKQNLDKTTEIIQNRVKTYVNEQR